MTALSVGEAFLPLMMPPGQYEHYALFGGRGGGKSYAAGDSCVIQACAREERIVCARQFQNSIRDSSKELIEKRIKAQNMAVYFTSTDREIVNVSTNARFTFLGMERNPESMKSLEGGTLVWVDEASVVSKRSIEILLPTVRAAGSRFIWTWNPRYRADEVDSMFRGSNPPDNSYIRQVGHRDNPYFMQTRMPSEMRRMMRANPKRFHHVWGGGYDENPETSIFPDWSIGRLPFLIPEKVIPRFGLDFGFGADPNILVKAYVIDAPAWGGDVDDKGVIYIAAEAHGHHVPNKALPALMDTVPGVRDWNIVGDSSRPETIDYLQSKGLNVYGAKKGAGSVKNGINFLAGYHLRISPDCPRLAEEVRDYKWRVDKNDRPLPMPAEGQADHGIDALRYAVEDLSTNDVQDDGVEYV